MHLFGFQRKDGAINNDTKETGCLKHDTLCRGPSEPGESLHGSPEKSCTKAGIVSTSNNDKENSKTEVNPADFGNHCSSVRLFVPS